MALSNEELIERVIYVAQEIKWLESKGADRFQLTEETFKLELLKRQLLDRLEGRRTEDEWVGDGHARCRFCNATYPTDAECPKHPKVSEELDSYEAELSKIREDIMTRIRGHLK